MRFKNNLYKIDGFIYRYLGLFQDNFGFTNYVFKAYPPFCRTSYKVCQMSDFDEKVLAEKFSLDKSQNVKVIAKPYLENSVIKEVEDEE
ncbi:MAG: hypothetical protein ACRCXX_07160 [Cetobacterium sp.]|uniref:hypothetical protein n=1 Tax=Cetobacterium sp. TaxID=2071632 RepID=UPI003F2E331A